MYKLATIRVLIAVAVVAVPSVGVSVQAAGAKPCDPDCVVVPKLLNSPTTKRLPNETSAVNFSAPAGAQFVVKKIKFLQRLLHLFLQLPKHDRLCTKRILNIEVRHEACQCHKSIAQPRQRIVTM